jgi:hypothetical protein
MNSTDNQNRGIWILVYVDDMRVYVEPGQLKEMDTIATAIDNEFGVGTDVGGDPFVGLNIDLNTISQVP